MQHAVTVAHGHEVGTRREGVHVDLQDPLAGGQVELGALHDTPDAIEHLHRHLYLTLQFLRGRPIGGFIRRLQQWEQLDRTAFDSLTRSLLRDSLAYARGHVPLYASEAWNRALSGTDPTDPTNWPVLERARVVTHLDQLLARPLPLGAFYGLALAPDGEHTAIGAGMRGRPMPGLNNAYILKMSALK